MQKYDVNIEWIKHIYNILNGCGMSFIWNSQTFPNTTWLYNNVKQILIDQFKQNWFSDINTSPKALNYRLFKDKFEFENYINILDDKNITTMCRFRTLNHHLPIEKGRWQNIPREQRKCTLCNSGDIGDEFHFLFVCQNLKDDRKKFLKEKYTCRPNCLKFNDLMNSNNISILVQLCKFIKLSIKLVNLQDKCILYMYRTFVHYFPTRSYSDLNRKCNMAKYS